MLFLRFDSAAQYSLGIKSILVDSICPIFINVGPNSANMLHTFDGEMPLFKSFLSITLVISSSLLTSLLFFIIIPLILIAIITFIKQKEKKAFNNSCFLKISFA